MTLEEWRSVVGYEDTHEVSSAGRVRSLDRTTRYRDGRTATFKGRVLSINLDDNGYAEVVLCRRGAKKRTVGVHRLMCEAFHGPKPTPKHEGRHLNGKPADNRPENLAWGTHTQNMQDKSLHGTNHWANQTHCIHGHEFTPENTRLERGDKKRACRACCRRKSRQRRLRLAS